ncbi:MAG TPA: hypothetical protein PKX41_02765 [Anaerolineaceae bacterium]|nr:hypothetical protein [Anaerolineaceae bacterium]
MEKIAPRMIAAFNRMWIASMVRFGFGKHQIQTNQSEINEKILRSSGGSNILGFASP